METRFWAATTTYYASMYAAVKYNPYLILITFLLFFTMPSLTEEKLLLGMEEQLNTQLQLLQEIRKQ